MTGRPANDGKLWTREQLILAFELYCRIPFSKTTVRNPAVPELGRVIGKTPAAVARKLGNFGRLDPMLADQQISGLRHGSSLETEIWEQFHNDWDGLVEQAHKLRQRVAPGLDPSPMFAPPDGPSERIVSAKQRLHQAFFRDAVLSSYEAKCCVTGLPLIPCLVAGHIIPWSVDERRRADPTNGVCMSATFDRLFDAGLVTIEDDLTLCVSPLVRKMRDEAVVEIVAARHGAAITVPTRFRPDPVCLRWHREHRYRAA